MKIQLRYGELSATLMSQHNSLVMIVNQALGGSPEADKPKDITAGARSAEEAVAMINKAFSF